jgi:PadR family transcriptional regulator, regulatory protein PadR
MSMANPRMTLPTQAVLQALLERYGEELYGFELSKASGLAAGTIYPILQRLTAAGWVSARWEDPEPERAAGRPPRRYYRLTVEGRARAVHALAAKSTSRSATTGLLNRPSSAEGGLA